MSPAIAFHFNVPASPQAYLCRLLRKASLAGLRSWVLLPQDLLRPLDDALWTFSAEDFIPHAVCGIAPPAQWQRAAVVLSDGAMPEPGAGVSVLVNLQPAVPNGFEGFQRLIEVVPEDDALKAAARQRWRHYTGLGYTIERHDVAQLAQRLQER
jgi:DNA polymerase-3 subunit chi